jgi:RNA polymerase sigma-70 factor (ECF subfamily)
VAELSDQWLLSAYCRGDRSAFDGLYRRYAPRVHATAFRLTGNWEDAEDTLQEVFISLAKKAPTIRRGAALSSWIYRSTVNRATDCLRRRRTQVSLDADTAESARILAVASLRREAERDDSARREALLRQIEGLIPRLPERQAAVFVLRFFQGLSHREISNVLNCSEASCRSHHSLACRKLREWVALKEDRDAEMPRAGEAKP